MQRLHRDALLGSIETPQDVDALGIIEPAGLGRLDGAAVAGQQTDTEFGLELLDVLGNAGLGGALAFGRGGEGRRLAYRDKGPDLAQGDHRMAIRKSNAEEYKLSFFYSNSTTSLKAANSPQGTDMNLGFFTMPIHPLGKDWRQSLKED